MVDSKLTNILFELKDEKYADFQAKLTPDVKRELFIGVRVPEVRKVVRQWKGTEEAEQFLSILPHRYYDENMLHGQLIAEIKDFDKCVSEIEKFLPYVDNWAVCDTISPKIFKKHKDELIELIRKWSASKHVYTCRFGIEMLMSFFLDDDFKEEYLNIPASVISDEYYVNMMTSWFFATALAKQWDKTIPYIENKKLGTFVHNKSIQKARESRRITEEQKAYLKSLKYYP